ncbi:MAG: hypothetical protein PVI90_09010 [Desulfobacteraceae bacterium]
MKVDYKKAYYQIDVKRLDLKTLFQKLKKNWIFNLVTREGDKVIISTDAKRLPSMGSM